MSTSDERSFVTRVASIRDQVPDPIIADQAHRSPSSALNLPLLGTLLILQLGLPAAAAERLTPSVRERVEAGQPIPWTELGAKTTAQASRDALAVVAGQDGNARLRCSFQQLEGEVTCGGLWLRSTANGAASPRFRVKADHIGREGGTRVALPEEGLPSLERGRAQYTRDDLREEYSVSVDGVRQDFVVANPPNGPGRLRVELGLYGLKAEPGHDGVRLVLDGSGRGLAYSRLRVVDREGRELRGRMEIVTQHRLAVVVADAGAVYPVRIDPTFSDANWVSLGALPGADGAIYAATTDAAGNLYVGGSFTVIGAAKANHIAKWDGTAWSALGSGLDNVVLALAVAGTDLFAAGYVTSSEGATISQVLRWNGNSWSALGSGMDNRVFALAASGTNLYAGGRFGTVGGVSASSVARWDGSVWSPLGAGVNDGVYALATSGSDLYAGGAFTTAGGQAANHIAKWDGSTWAPLGPGTSDSVLALAASGTDLFAGGSFTAAGGASANHVAKWDGVSWSALGSGMDKPVVALAVSGTSLYAGGAFTTAGGSDAGGVARWNGAYWSPLGSGTSDRILALAVAGTSLYAGGTFTTVGGVGAHRVARWNGSVWSRLGSGTGLDGSVYALALSGTRLYAAGAFTRAGGLRVNHVAQWDGSAWSALGSGTDDRVYALTVSGTNLYAGGAFTTAGGVAAHSIAKWDGVTWSALGSGMNDDVLALAVLGTNLYAGGYFTTADTLSANHMASWDGTAWSPVGSGMNDEVDALAISGTDLYAGGWFTTAGGLTANYVAKWDGTAWSPVGPGMNDHVAALAVSGTEVYAGGYFTTAGALSANHVAKWDGSAWSPLGFGMSGSYVGALTFSGTDLYAGGLFTAADGSSANHIAKWDGTGWTALGSGMNSSVSALAISGTDLYAGGGFSTSGGIISAYAAKALLQGLVASNATYARGLGPSLEIRIADIAWDVNDNPVTVQSLGVSAQGATLSFDNTNIYYVPANDNNDSFNYTVSNGSSTATGTVKVTVGLPPNTAPVATPNRYTLVEDDSLSGNVITDDTGDGVDSDADHDPLTAHLDTGPLHARSFRLSPDGSFSYAPRSDFNGADSFTYLVDDGRYDSELVAVTLTVVPVNQAPTFTKGPDLTTAEDSGPESDVGWASAIRAGPPDESAQTLEFQLSNNNVELFSSQPTLSADGTLTFIPAPNANGTAVVTISLKDNGGTAYGGTDTSAPQTFTVTVVPVNDPPRFTKGPNLAIAEDSGAQAFSGWATAITAGPPNEAAQSLSFDLSNNNSALFSAQPALGADGTLTFTPAPNANGTATVAVTLKDNGGTDYGGLDTSGTRTFTITLVPVNDPPSFAKGADVMIPEDSGPQTITGWATAITAGPSDEADQTVVFLLSNDNNGLFSTQPALSPEGTLTFTAAPNANGTAIVTAALQDNGGTAKGGVNTSAPETFTITVTPVNDPPVANDGDASGNEDHTISGTVRGTDLDGDTLTFVLVANAAHGTVDLAADGKFTYAPAPDYNGSDGFTFKANDGQLDSAPATVTLKVTPVNDAPSFIPGPDQLLAEDAGPQAVAAWATAIKAGPADEVGQTVAFQVTNSNAMLFSVQPFIGADGSLGFTPATSANGTASVTVRLKDDGGTANGGIDESVPFTFIIRVSPVDDPPSFEAGPDQTVNYNAGAQVVPGWATAISAGPLDEAAQTLRFELSASDPALFAELPAISATGTLTYTPATNANGSATVTVVLKDDGGTASGGVDTSAPHSLTITVLGPVIVTGVGVSDGKYTLSWTSIAGRAYRIQYKTRLEDSQWTNLGTPILATGPTASAVDDVTGVNQRFYRVVRED